MRVCVSVSERDRTFQRTRIRFCEIERDRHRHRNVAIKYNILVVQTIIINIINEGNYSINSLLLEILTRTNDNIKAAYNKLTGLITLTL